jgi:hypothetical protein
MKYTNQIEIFVRIPASIHPIWLIEEKDKILRMDVCERPRMPPYREDIIMQNTSIYLENFLSKQEERSAKGATFCHESKIELLIQESPSTI